MTPLCSCAAAMRSCGPNMRLLAVGMRRPERDRLPPGWSLVGLPPAIEAEFRRLATAVIRDRFVPFLWLRNARAHRRNAVAARGALYTKAAVLATLSQSDFLRQWPETLLKTLAASAVLRVFRRGEIVLHAAEPCGPSLSFVMGGAVELLQPNAAASAAASVSFGSVRSRASFVLRRRQKGVIACVASGTAREGYVLADVATVCEELFPHYAVATEDHVDVIEVPRSAVARAFEGLPPTVAGPLLRSLSQRREATLPATAPLTPPRILLAALFCRLPPHGVARVQQRATPLSFSAGSTILQRDTIPPEMLFIRRGLAALVDSHGRRMAVLRDGASIAERELYFGEKLAYSVVAISVVDAYGVKAIDLHALKVDEALARCINSAAADERERDMSAVNVADMQGLRRLVAAIPLFGIFAAEGDVDELLTLLKPRVLNSRELIVSTSEICDRVVLLTRGSARVRDSSHRGGGLPFVVGEAIGYTCLVEHRWTAPVVALEPVDVWEIPRAEYMRFLQRRGLYKRVLGATMMLVQPMLHFRDRCAELEGDVTRLPQPNTLPQLRTPNLHPVSLDAHVTQFPPLKLRAPPPPRDKTALAGGDAQLKRRSGTVLRIPDAVLLDIGTLGEAAVDEDAAQVSVTPTSVRPAKPSELPPAREKLDVCKTPEGECECDAFGNVRSHSFAFPAPPLNTSGDRKSCVAVPMQSETPGLGHDDGVVTVDRQPASNARSQRAAELDMDACDLSDDEDHRQAGLLRAELQRVSDRHCERVASPRARLQHCLDSADDVASSRRAARRPAQPVRRPVEPARPQPKTRSRPSASLRDPQPQQPRTTRLSVRRTPARPSSARAAPRVSTGRMLALPWSGTESFGSLLGKMEDAAPGFTWHGGCAFGVPRAMLRDFVGRESHHSAPCMPPAPPPQNARMTPQPSPPAPRRSAADDEAAACDYRV